MKIVASLMLLGFSLFSTTVSKPRLPIMLQFRKADITIQTMFRENLSARQIDTINWRDALARETEIIKNKLAEARANGGATARVYDDFESIKNIVVIDLSNATDPIDQIGWKAFVPGKFADTTTRYYKIPDSLRNNLPKAIDGCIDVILKSKNIR